MDRTRESRPINRSHRAEQGGSARTRLHGDRKGGEAELTGRIEQESAVRQLKPQNRTVRQCKGMRLHGDRDRREAKQKLLFMF